VHLDRPDDVATPETMSGHAFQACPTIMQRCRRLFENVDHAPGRADSQGAICVAANKLSDEADPARPLPRASVRCANSSVKDAAKPRLSTSLDSLSRVAC